MTIETDPKTVREVAQDALTIAIRRGRTESVEAALIAHGGASPVLGEKFDAYTSAAIAEYSRLAAVMTRPDEQLQDNGDLRAIVNALDLIDGLCSGDVRPSEVSHKRNALYEHFAGRIAALDARDAMAADAERGARRPS